MILTYKIKHGQDYSEELKKAEKIAWIGFHTKTLSSKDVNHIGLKSIISNQILKKYSKNGKIKSVKNVKLTIPNQGIKIKSDKIYIPSLKLYLDIWFDRNFEKINQIEIGKEYAYISVSYKDKELIKPKTFIGVDRNTTHHALVAADLNGKVLKLGKSYNHIHNKYKNIRKDLQKKGKYKKVKKIKNRESKIIKNLNHQISKVLIDYAVKVEGGLVLENLKGIRNNAKTRRKQRYSLNSWSFYQLGQMIEYKAKKQGIPVFYIEPQYTSQRCSRCGHIEKANRNGNLFQCKKCGKVEDSGVNAGWNLAWAQSKGILRFGIDRDMSKGSTDTPKEAMFAI
jgi:putative transposase